MIKQPKSLAMILAAFGVVYALVFWIMVTINAHYAQSRFDILVDSGAGARAITHGEQVIAIRTNDGADPETLVDIKMKLAELHAGVGNNERSIALYRQVLASRKATSMAVTDRATIRNTIARLSLLTGDTQQSALIYADFLEAAGDEAARLTPASPGSLEAVYAEQVRAAMPGFAEALPPVHDREILTGSETERLEAASAMTTLGGYYAMLDGDYAAAGLLSAAYVTRVRLLGPADQDTLQSALLLGPVYQKIGRYKDTEALYLAAFHAQEKAKGSNSPELTLYIRLLADVYKAQNRMTEAEALNTHIRRLFSDAFGARRYVSNQKRDRRMDINRPVSSGFPLSESYKPNDLVPAATYSLPLSKPAGLEEMSIRKAELAEDQDVSTMPEQLGKLLVHCGDAADEKLSLRSGYRSYQTQVHLFERNTNGTVTTPGTSEHQLGLAADIDVNGRLMRSTDRAYQCFEENAWRFGFILSYPPDNTYLPGPDTYEPWHWRYVGTQTALLYREAGPIRKPQEFLAALPCYEERAMAGIWSIASEEDVCLAQAASQAIRATAAGESQKAP